MVMQIDDLPNFCRAAARVSAVPQLSRWSSILHSASAAQTSVINQEKNVLVVDL